MNQGATSTRHTLHTLFVEDSEVDVELIVLELKREGFDVTWKRVETEEGLRRTLFADGYHVVLSDYSMPTFSGIDALRIVRELDPYIPFIFVSGTIGEDRAIESIRMGATDYVLKGNLRRLGTAVRRARAEAEEKQRTLALEADRSRLAAILEATSDYVAICDPDLRLTYINAAGRELLGLGEEADINGRQATKFHPEWAVNLLDREAWTAIRKAGIWQGETALLTGGGEEIPLSQVLIGHKNQDGELDYISTIGRDIRERKAYEKQISYLANYDGLTRLPNRNLLRDRVLQAISHSLRSHARHSERPSALLIADVDRFKMVNDGFGSETGDVLLRMVGERLQATLREGDSVARLGADEFAILSVDLKSADDVLAVVRKIQAAMQAPFVLNDKETYVSLGIGASLIPRDGEDFESLLRHAEVAMHRAKGHGPGSFEYYATHMTRDVEDRMEIENGLRNALAHDELQMHYQPQVRIDSNGVIGVEALMRWRRQDGEWVSPGVFIPVAEDSELILALGEFALSSACRQLRDWNTGQSTTLPLRMSVNVSARQFRSKGFVATVERALSLNDIDPLQLELELTEGVLIEDKEDVTRILQELKGLGVRISVDDFGTGYSSLSYLSQLPIDCLKIDQSFVRSLSEDSYNAHIIQAIVSMAHSLEMNVIAEGIETREQLEFLRGHDCDEGQGFLFAKPMSADDIASVLKQGSIVVKTK